MSIIGRFFLLLHLWIVSTEDLKPLLIYANLQSIEKLELDTRVSSTLVRGLYKAVALDYHYDEGYIFWADQNADRITRMNISNPDDKVDIITNTLDQPVAIAVDWIYNHLYWVDTRHKHIMVSKTDGTLRKTLVKTDLFYPRSIVVHPISGWLYFIDVKSVPKIARCGLDGNDRETIISSGLAEPKGLSIDYTSNRLYWIDTRLQIMTSLDLDGRGMGILTRFTEERMWVSGLAVFEDWIYWVTYSNNTLYRVNKENGTIVEAVKTGLRSPVGIKIYSKQNQPSGRQFCLNNNDGCEHLCLPSPKSSKIQCTCADGFLLRDDGKRCRYTGSRYWLTYANMMTIERIDIDSNITETVYGRANSAVDIDIHFEKGLVYWTDFSKRKISRSSLTKDAVSGTSTDIITDMIETPYGIAIDWIYNLMYWTDTGMNHIQVSRLDGSYRRTIVKGGSLDQPRAIVVDPSTGWLFFSQFGSQPRIERCRMDGRDRQIIVQHDIIRPNGMSIDYVDKRLYWIDGQLNHIKSTTFDGSDTNTVVQDKNILPNPFDLVVFNSYVYWSNWHHNSISRINKYTGKDFVFIADNLRSPMGIQMFGPTSQVTGENVCRQNNGGCSHICFPAPESSDRSQSITSECMCPDPFELTNDKKTCNATDVLVTKDTEESSKDGLSSREIIVYSTVSTVFVIIILISVSIFFYRHRRKLPPAKCISTVADDYDIINDDNRLSRIVQNSPSGEYLNPEYIDPCHTWTTTM